MDNLVTITVDGMQIQAPKGMLLWEACKANGIDIPIFCYHTKLGAVGACRTCLVEQEGVTKGPITACSTPIADDMVIRTRSAVAQKAQRGIFEFLLANHPLDCPICDRGGECPLQDQTFTFGPGTSRYIEPKRHHVKPIALGPTIALDRERCVLCWRCVRFCAEVAEDKSIVLQDRGDHTVVGTFQNRPYVSNFSGNVVELCPVGALTSRMQRFNFRPWELQNRPSVCPHCAMGCNINVSVRKNDEVIRFLSRDNPEVDDSWLCDRGRFNYEFINSPERIASPLIRRGEAFEETSWEEALTYIAERLHEMLDDAEHQPDSIVGVASPRLTNEDLYVFKRFMTDVLGSSELDHFPRSQLLLSPAQQEAYDRLDRVVMPISDLDRARTILLLGGDPSTREPVLELRIRLAVNRHGAKLVVVNDEDIPLSLKANDRYSYREGGFSNFVQALVTRIRGGASGASEPGTLEHLAATYLVEGPVAVIYDDAFDRVRDKGEAVEAVDALIAALGTVGEVGVIPLLVDCNSMGARDLRVLPGDGSWGSSAVSRLLDPSARIRAAFLLGANIVKDLGPRAEDALRRLDLVVIHELAMTETARFADVILPAASFAEKMGTFTNTERRVQLLSETVPSPGIARADWQILVDLSQYLDASLDYALPRDVWDHIKRDVPKYAALSYTDIGPTGARPSVLQLV